LGDTFPDKKPKILTELRQSYHHLSNLKSLSVRDSLLFFGGTTPSILDFKKTNALIQREFFNFLPNLPSKSFKQFLPLNPFSI